MLGESGDIGCYNHNEIIQLSLHTIPGHLKCAKLIVSYLNHFKFKIFSLYTRNRYFWLTDPWIWLGYFSI